MDILEMAKDLARAIQKDERYLKMQEYRDRNDQDETLQGMIQDFNMIRMNLNNETSKEERDNERISALDSDLNRVYGEIMSNPNMTEYAAAKAEVDTVVKKINAMMNYAVNGMDPEMAEAEGCGGSCEGCAGCS